MVLDGKELPWVDSALHLGHILHESGSMEQNVKIKRATFIEEIFWFWVLPVFYLGSHYGSNLWQLDSQMARQYFSAWRTCVKLAAT